MSKQRQLDAMWRQRMRVEIRGTRPTPVPSRELPQSPDEVIVILDHPRTGTIRQNRFAVGASIGMAVAVAVVGAVLLVGWKTREVSNDIDWEP